VSTEAMKTVQVGNVWIIWTANREPIGPYDTKAEAESDRVGMERYLRHGHKPGFMTTDTKRR
jgi:hypothetical protein